MSTWYLETVTPAHLDLLKKIGQVDAFTLVGGTALALQIGHRKSYDLDFVTTKKITSSLVDELLKKLQPKELQQRLSSETQYTAFVDGIKITIFQDPAALLHDTVEYEGSHLASVADIFATKLFVLGKRNFWRDYVDIACCLKFGHTSLAQGLEESMRRYKVAQKWILEPLVYFHDIEIVPIEWVNYQPSVQEIQNILISEVENVVGKES